MAVKLKYQQPFSRIKDCAFKPRCNTFIITHFLYAVETASLSSQVEQDTNKCQRFGKGGRSRYLHRRERPAGVWMSRRGEKREWKRKKERERGREKKRETERGK